MIVVGDVMLDRFIYGRVERVSPEAPIPVLHQQSERLMLGGAANVARNILALGGKAVLIGVVGEDADGQRIAGELCGDDGIDGRLVRIAGHPTTVKTRLVSGAQQLVRLDVEHILTLDQATEDRLFAAFESAVHGAAAVVLSDYAKGVLAPRLIARIIASARRHAVPVIVDPKSRDVARYAGAHVLTPNAVEAEQISGQACSSDDEVEAAAQTILARASVDAVVVTRGADGMTIWAPAESGEHASHIRAMAREVFDVSGAGDTVVATLALALAGGASISAAATMANAAAGIAVGKRGTAVVRSRELARALQQEGTEHGSPKIVSLETAREMVADWKENGVRVGFTNGCFDLLHPGHIDLLKRARATCDRLVVALNTDASVQRLKGPGRPVQNEMARSIVMAAIDSVDLVLLFDEDTPINAIEALKPDRLIKGADYTVATVVGAAFVQSYGGEVVLVPLAPGHSTTSIIARSRA